MNKFLLALALIAASAAPALADYGKEQTYRHRQLEPAYQRHSDLRRMRGAPDLRQANDPYWKPCDYSSDTDANSCM